MTLTSQVAAILLLCPLVALTAQTPPQSASPATARAEEKPLLAIPYSPSLDLTSLDASADPCSNFYQYTCGGWMKANPIPADQASWDVYSKLAVENQQFLWGILEQDATAKNRTPNQQKVGDYFAACMNVPAMDALGVKPLQPALDRVDKLATRPALLSALASIDRDNAGTFFFSARIGQDAADASRQIVELGAAGLGLPDRDYYLKTDAKSLRLREQYVSYIEQLLTLAGQTPAHATAQARQVLDLETALATASLTRVERRDPRKVYHIVTLAQLTQITPSLDWPGYLRSVGAPAVPDTLNLSQPDFFKALQTQLANQPLEALQAYLRFHLLTGAASTLAQPFRQAYFDFFSTTLRGIPAMPPRWKTCTQAVDRSLGEALGQEFVRRTFSPQMKAQTQLMTRQIEAQMLVEIDGLDWMSPETKAEARRKLHAIRNKIGYPDQWRDYTALTVKSDDFFGNTRRAARFEEDRNWHKLGQPVDLNEWGMSPPTVNAYFSPQMNDINFPAGILQPPLYDAKEDDAPNYGNTGSTIGHELTHAFDDEGRKFDEKGNLRDWWTTADANGFEQRIDCVRDQYAGYIVVDDIHLNSKLTSGEDVADLGGTLLAYMAWKQQTASQTLAPIDGFTPDQRYFIGMAQWACENDRPENLRVRAATDPHSPGIDRVNGVVANLPEFQKAFACKPGQAMVHVPACKVW